jgi:hypothetical protein
MIGFWSLDNRRQWWLAGWVMTRESWMLRYEIASPSLWILCIMHTSLLSFYSSYLRLSFTSWVHCCEYNALCTLFWVFVPLAYAWILSHESVIVKLWLMWDSQLAWTWANVIIMSLRPIFVISLSLMNVNFMFVWN